MYEETPWKLTEYRHIKDSIFNIYCALQRDVNEGTGRLKSPKAPGNSLTHFEDSGKFHHWKKIQIFQKFVLRYSKRVLVRFKMFKEASFFRIRTVTSDPEGSFCIAQVRTPIDRWRWQNYSQNKTTDVKTHKTTFNY
ncbi:hypothetical protein NQ315_011475 [Exocentrus adspersus]|uniref:Uncharacterized protein n=1 Tax=Exocentrus adspersus TaxID=1586481 RepID=A0AAV8VVT7_9CUCU|nr:hypothetical protein NQ315_011475 [Exocentrus adspersus]